jgi:hypothetical protein
LTPKSFEIKFPHEQTARAAEVQGLDELGAVLHDFGFERTRPTLVMVGGAAGLGKDLKSQIHRLFMSVLAPLAQTLGAYVVDGATDSGVIQLMGRARKKIGGTFPLIGVAAQGTVRLPDAAATERDTWSLEPHHTHFVLVPGNDWGDEVPWISRVVDLLAEGTSSATVLVNGGKVAWEDAEQSVSDDRPVVVIAGSGRTADILAAAARGDKSNERANRLVDSGLLRVVDLAADTDLQCNLIEEILSKGAKHGRQV